ncbi:hypothetical protein F7Q99_35090 [Streptomyces kaniharaensis]|uniref:Uncharacterized protein n=1 Tax=Streptomyces kaniharaensis TaxID=212423 RepID=A0A6N7L3C4_9ACTN|nr:hypothetical protein [Streptomyces kaniharaensis]MQS17267.1 hypothetical protein [Streptomyces kaniharaensis]
MPKPLSDIERHAQDAVLRATEDDLKHAFGALATTSTALPPELGATASRDLPPDTAAAWRAAFPVTLGAAHDVYPQVPAELRTDLRDALIEFFADSPEHPVPSAVTFIVTNDYDDGPAWNTYGATLHYGPHVTVEAPDFDRTFVADALIEIADDEQPYGTPSPVLFVPLHA